jgi:signal peptidase I
MKKIILDNIKTLFYALIIALLIRTFLFQPFYIPSSSMEPSLLIGDRLFVSKYAYGFSRHSFPFSPTNYNIRFFEHEPKRGDVIVFKTPADDRTDYIKRLIGLPGDTIQFIKGEFFLNNMPVKRTKINNQTIINCGSEVLDVNFFEEELDGVKYTVAYRKKGTLKNTDKYTVPSGHYFFMGDNRDCSKDSRYLSSVGYVSFNNLVGKAKIIFFSNNIKEGYFIKFWKWNKSIRLKRFFKYIT